MLGAWQASNISRTPLGSRDSARPSHPARMLREVAHAAARGIVAGRMSTAVYVHFPWCLQKCPYCDFASASIRRPDVPHREYADAVLRELSWHVRDNRGPLGELRSIFFGGG